MEGGQLDPVRSESPGGEKSVLGGVRNELLREKASGKNTWFGVRKPGFETQLFFQQQ